MNIHKNWKAPCPSAVKSQVSKTTTIEKQHLSIVRFLLNIMNKLSIILAIFVLINSTKAWDTEELEIFDLVEEIKENFYTILGVNQVSDQFNTAMWQFSKILSSFWPIFRMRHYRKSNEHLETCQLFCIPTKMTPKMRMRFFEIWCSFMMSWRTLQKGRNMTKYLKRAYPTGNRHFITIEKWRKLVLWRPRWFCSSS